MSIVDSQQKNSGVGHPFGESAEISLRSTHRFDDLAARLPHGIFLIKVCREGELLILHKIITFLVWN